MLPPAELDDSGTDHNLDPCTGGSSASVAVNAFDEAQSAIMAEFGSRSPAHDAVMGRCSDTAQFFFFEDFIPEEILTLRNQLEEEVQGVLQTRESDFRSWAGCMADAGFAEIERPSELFDYFLNERQGDPYPLDESPSNGGPGETWIESRQLEEALAVADATCRRVGIEALDSAFLNLAEEFTDRNSEAIQAVPQLWEGLAEASPS